MPPLVPERSLLKQIACNTSADCGDHTCSCSEIGLCVCFISATKELNLNNMQFEDLKQEDLKELSVNKNRTNMFVIVSVWALNSIIGARIMNNIATTR